MKRIQGKGQKYANSPQYANSPLIQLINKTILKIKELKNKYAATEDSIERKHADKLFSAIEKVLTILDKKLPEFDNWNEPNIVFFLLPFLNSIFNLRTEFTTRKFELLQKIEKVLPNKVKDKETLLNLLKNDESLKTAEIPGPPDIDELLEEIADQIYVEVYSNKTKVSDLKEKIFIDGRGKYGLTIAHPMTFELVAAISRLVQDMPPDIKNIVPFLNPKAIEVTILGYGLQYKENNNSTSLFNYKFQTKKKCTDINDEFIYTNIVLFIPNLLYYQSVFLPNLVENESKLASEIVRQQKGKLAESNVLNDPSITSEEKIKYLEELQKSNNTLIAEFEQRKSFKVAKLLEKHSLSLQEQTKLSNVPYLNYRLPEKVMVYSEKQEVVAIDIRSAHEKTMNKSVETLTELNSNIAEEISKLKAQPLVLKQPQPELQPQPQPQPQPQLQPRLQSELQPQLQLESQLEAEIALEQDLIIDAEPKKDNPSSTDDAKKMSELLNEAQTKLQGLQKRQKELETIALGLNEKNHALEEDENAKLFARLCRISTNSNLDTNKELMKNILQNNKLNVLERFLASIKTDLDLALREYKQNEEMLIQTNELLKKHVDLDCIPFQDIDNLVVTNQLKDSTGFNFILDLIGRPQLGEAKIDWANFRKQQDTPWVIRPKPQEYIEAKNFLHGGITQKIAKIDECIKQRAQIDREQGLNDNLTNHHDHDSTLIEYKRNKKILTQVSKLLIVRSDYIPFQDIDEFVVSQFKGFNHLLGLIGGEEEIDIDWEEFRVQQDTPLYFRPESREYIKAKKFLHEGIPQKIAEIKRFVEQRYEDLDQIKVTLQKNIELKNELEQNKNQRERSMEECTNFEKELLALKSITEIQGKIANLNDKIATVLHVNDFQFAQVKELKRLHKELSEKAEKDLNSLKNTHNDTEIFGRIKQAIADTGNLITKKIQEKFDSEIIKLDNLEVKLKEISAQVVQSSDECDLIKMSGTPTEKDIKNFIKNQYIITDNELWFVDCTKKSLKKLSFLNDNLRLSLLEELKFDKKHTATKAELRLITFYTGHTSSDYRQLITDYDNFITKLLKPDIESLSTLKEKFSALGDDYCKQEIDKKKIDSRLHEIQLKAAKVGSNIANDLKRLFNSLTEEANVFLNLKDARKESQDEPVVNARTLQVLSSSLAALPKDEAFKKLQDANVEDQLNKALKAAVEQRELNRKLNLKLLERIGERQKFVNGLVVDKLDKYLTQRNQKYKVKDALSSSDKDARVEFVEQLKGELALFNNSGDSTKLRNFIDTNISRFPGIHLQSLLNKIWITTIDLDRKIPVNYYSVAPEVSAELLHKSALEKLRLLSVPDDYLANLRSLYKQINDMRQYAVITNQIASDLADKLQNDVDRFVIANGDKLPSTEAYQQFKKEFLVRLHSEDSAMSQHRASWKPIIVNIALSVATLCKIIYSKATTGCCSFFFDKTERQKKIGAIEESVKKIDPSVIPGEIAMPSSSILLEQGMLQ
jgi:hypothetical protein